MWCARTGSCRLTHFTAQSSLQNRILLHKPLWFSFMATIFTLNSTCMSFFYSWSACFSPPPFASSNERERERDSHKSHDPLLLFSPLLSLLLSFSSSSPFPLRILKLSIADSAPREARLRLQRLLHSAWATIPIWITFTTVGVEVPQCVFRDL